MKKIGIALVQGIGGSLGSIVGGLVGGVFTFIFLDCLTTTCSNTTEFIVYGINSIFAWGGAWGVVVGIGKLFKTQVSWLGSAIGTGVGVILTLILLPEEYIVIAAFFLPTLGYWIIPTKSNLTQSSANRGEYQGE